MELDRPDAPLQSRRTLADLPPELKAIIARMARDQDLAYKERVQEHRRVRELASLGKSDSDGKSAQALFLVDRAWSAAVAPRLFETITSKPCHEDLIFFRIGIQHRRFFKSAIFNHDNESDDWRCLPRAIPSFVNLQHTKLTREASRDLFNAEDDYLDDDERTLREALQSIAPSIPSLHFETKTPNVFQWMLPLFVNLRRFQGRTIERLHLDGAVEGLLAELVKERMESPWPSLRSFQLGLRAPLGLAGWRFIRIVGKALETVTLFLNGAGLSDDLVKESEAPLPTFPALHSLKIKGKGSPTDLTALLKLFSASPIRHLAVLVTGNGLRASSDLISPATLLTSLFRLFPTHLQNLQYNHLPYTDLHHLRSLVPTLPYLATARNFALTLGTSYGVFLHRPRLSAPRTLPPDDVSRTCDDFDEVLRRGLEQTSGLRPSKDVFAMEKLEEALLSLKASMGRARD